MRIMALHFFRSHDKPISLYQLVDGCEVAVWAHTICLSNLDELWKFHDQTNEDLNARKCWKVCKQINNHFPIEITCDRSCIILNRLFFNIPTMISEPSNRFAASLWKHFGDRQLTTFFSLSPTFITRNIDCKGPSLFRYVSNPALTNSTLMQGRTQGGGLGLTPPLELDILQKLYYLRKEIKCFRILFAC